MYRTFFPIFTLGVSSCLEMGVWPGGVATSERRPVVDLSRLSCRKQAANLNTHTCNNFYNDQQYLLSIELTLECVSLWWMEEHRERCYQQHRQVQTELSVGRCMCTLIPPKKRLERDTTKPWFCPHWSKVVGHNHLSACLPLEQF